MSFFIDLYSFSKKVNSTKLPIGAGRIMQGALRDDCDIISPVVSFSFAGPVDPQTGRPNPMTSEFNPYQYNYAHIGVWDRYYFIDSWEWSGGLWWAHMSVDVLASFRTDIIDETYYILRAANTASWDPEIIDTIYPAKANIGRIVHVEGGSAMYTTNMSQCTYLMTCLGGSNGQITYVMSHSEMVAVMTALFPQATDNLSTWLNKKFDQAAVGGISNIKDNIVSFKVLPINYSTIASLITGVSIVQIGNFVLTTAPAVGYIAGECIYAPTSGQAIEVGNFADTQAAIDPASGRGKWTILEPFRTYEVYIPAIGTIHLDGSKLCSGTAANYVYITTAVSLVTGIVTYHVYYGMGAGDTAPLQGVYTVQLATDLMSGGQGSFSSGAMLGILKGVGEIALGIATENPAMIGAGVGTGIGSAVQLQAGETTSIGHGVSGILPSLKDKFKSVCYIHNIADEDREEKGRPLMKRQTIRATGVGYVQVEEGDVAISGATKSELEQIKQHLETGFYYEV